MSKGHLLREIQRLQGSRQHLQLITALQVGVQQRIADRLAPEGLHLLRQGPAIWHRRFQPRPEHQSTVSAVLVSCVGNVAVVEVLFVRKFQFVTAS